MTATDSTVPWDDLVAQGWDGPCTPQGRNGLGNTPLCWALRRHQPANLDWVRALLDAGVDPQVANHRGETPLMLATDAAKTGHGVHLVDLLRQAGATPEGRSDEDFNGLVYAVLSGEMDLVHWWIQHPQTPVSPLHAPAQASPLWLAMKGDRWDMVDAMLRAQVVTDEDLALVQRIAGPSLLDQLQAHLERQQIHDDLGIMEARPVTRAPRV